jgi:BMFP domain-containing protein YqiC
MVTRPDLAKELSKAAGDAMRALTGLKSEAEIFAKAKLERLLAEMKLVTQDEFEAVKAMAAKARAEQERLEARIAVLEAKLGVEAPKPAAKTVRKKAAKPESR